MPHFTISFTHTNDKPDIRIEAEYYRHEDGWVTLKDADHKVVAAVPERVVRMISSEKPSAVAAPATSPPDKANADLAAIRKIVSDASLTPGQKSAQVYATVLMLDATR